MSRAYDSSIQKQRNNETTRWQRVKTIIQMGLPLGSNRALLLNVIQWSAFLDYADDWRNWGESRSQSGRHPTDRVPLAERATSSAVWIIASVLLTKRTMECISPVEMLVFYYLSRDALHYWTGNYYTYSSPGCGNTCLGTALRRLSPRPKVYN